MKQQQWEDQNPEPWPLSKFPLPMAFRERKNANPDLEAGRKEPNSPQLGRSLLRPPPHGDLKAGFPGEKSEQGMSGH